MTQKLYVALFAATALTLAACGGEKAKNPQQPSEETPAAAEIPAVTETPAVEPTPDATLTEPAPEAPVEAPAEAPADAK